MLIIMCTTAAVSIGVMLLGTCVPVRNENRQNYNPSDSQFVYKQVLIMSFILMMLRGYYAFYVTLYGGKYLMKKAELHTCSLYGILICDLLQL